MRRDSETSRFVSSGSTPCISRTFSPCASAAPSQGSEETIRSSDRPAVRARAGAGCAPGVRLRVGARTLDEHVAVGDGGREAAAEKHEIGDAERAQGGGGRAREEVRERGLARQT